MAIFWILLKVFLKDIQLKTDFKSILRLYFTAVICFTYFFFQAKFIKSLLLVPHIQSIYSISEKGLINTCDLL